LDEHGQLRLEDIQRQEILERAGWNVLRIPYRKWRKDPHTQIERVIEALSTKIFDDAPEYSDSDEHIGHSESLRLANYEAAILLAVQKGHHDKENVLRHARELAGHARLGSSIRVSLEAAIRALVSNHLVVVEDGSVFGTDRASSAEISAIPRPISPRRQPSRKTYGGQRSNYRSNRRRY
jgi:hypothetical protein